MAIILPNGTPLQGPQCPEDIDLAAYFPLAAKWARRYAGSFGFDDAFAIALTGLVVALNKWQPARGPYGAVAHHWVRCELNAALHRQQLAQGRAFKNTTLGRSYGRAGKLTRFQQQQDSATLVPLNAPLPGGDGNGTFADSIPSSEPNPEDVLIEADEAAHLRRRLAAALAKLPRREAQIVIGRTVGVPLRTVGKRLGLSAERARQLEKRAMAKLRNAMGAPATAPLVLPNGKPRKARPAGLQATPARAAGPPHTAKAATRHDKSRRPPRPRAWVKAAAGKWEAVAWC